MWLEFEHTTYIRAYLSTETRAQALIVGGMLAFATIGWQGARNRWLDHVMTIAGAGGLAFLVYLMFRLRDTSAPYYKGGELVIALATGAVILAVSQVGHSPFARALGWRPLAALGRISYGVYLYHMPIYFWLGNGSQGTNTVGGAIELIGISIAVATVSYYAIERPIRRGAFRRVRLRFAVPSAIAASAAVVAVACTASASAPLAKKLTPIQVEYYGTIRATAGARSRVLVAGDVLAYELGQPYPHGFRAHDIAGAVVSPFGCSIGDGDILLGVQEERGPSCAGVFDDYEAATRAYAPNVAVLMIGSTEVLDRVVDGRRLLVGTIGLERYLDGRLDLARQALTSTGATLVLTTVPCMNPPTQGAYAFLARYQSDPGRVAWLNGVWQRYADAHRGSVVLADLHKFLCPGGAHRATFDGRPLGSADGIGFTPLGASRTWQWLTPIITAATRAVPVAGGA
jgi:hypothetical protein